MNKYQTDSIVIRRVDYGEYDRIITFLTSSQGKVSAIAKGVKKPKSKMAGGLDLFSTSHVTIMKGKGNLDHVISARLNRFFGNILEDYDRVQMGYKAIKIIDSLTENDAPSPYFHLVANTYSELDDLEVSTSAVEVWFRLQTLKLLGHNPDLENFDKFERTAKFNFALDDGQFIEQSSGLYSLDHIKSWRLLLDQRPSRLKNIQRLEEVATQTIDPLRSFFKLNFSINE